MSEHKKPKITISRRKFLRSMALFVGVITASLTGVCSVLTKWKNRLRPPGSKKGIQLLSQCIKCGQCVQVCPVKAVKLADVRDGYGVAVPYINSREQACDFSCDGLQCILACPTGALELKESQKEKVTMGTAVLINPDSCLARQGKPFQGISRGKDFQGLLRYKDIDPIKPTHVNQYTYNRELCDLCVISCPIENAISLQPFELTRMKNTNQQKTPTITDACVGCGVCEMICPVEESCISINPYGRSQVV